MVKNQLDFVHVLIKMHPTADQNMGNKPMLVQNFDEQHLVHAACHAVDKRRVAPITLWPSALSKAQCLV